MPTFYPSLADSKKHDESFDITNPEYTKIKKYFELCIVFHKLQVNPKYLENPTILNWFKFVIVHHNKGIICIADTNYYKNETQELTNRILNINNLQPNRIKVIIENNINDALDKAKEIFNNWTDVNAYEHNNTVNILKEIYQIDSLPIIKFNEKSAIRDNRFTEISIQYGLVRDIEVELLKMERHRLQKIKIYVNSGAGSGKTIAAIHAYNRLIKLGKKPIFVCYNHLLGNLLRDKVIDPRSFGYVGTLFKFAKGKIHKNNVANVATDGNHVEFMLGRLNLEEGNPDKFNINNIEKYDALIVDEGQDFKDNWVELLSLYLKPDASVLWFEDKNQTILMEEFDHAQSGLESVRADVLRKIDMTFPQQRQIMDKPNYRATTYIEDFLITFFQHYRIGTIPCLNYVHVPDNIKIIGEKVKINFYEEGCLLEKLQERIDYLKNQEHIELNDIEIVSCLPYDIDKESELLQIIDTTIPYQYSLNGIGDYPLKRFTGKLENGLKVYKQDDGIFCESITKYKGKESPVILVVDVERPNDFLRYDWAQLLYCSLTRATMHMEIFVCNEGNMSECFIEVEREVNEAII